MWCMGYDVSTVTRGSVCVRGLCILIGYKRSKKTSIFVFLICLHMIESIDSYFG